MNLFQNLGEVPKNQKIDGAKAPSCQKPAECGCQKVGSQPPGLETEERPQDCPCAVGCESGTEGCGEASRALKSSHLHQYFSSLLCRSRFMVRHCIWGGVDSNSKILQAEVGTRALIALHSILAFLEKVCQPLLCIIIGQERRGHPYRMG